MLLKGKVCLVVGINNDVGRTTAISMAKAGARVAIADEDCVRGEAIANKINQSGGQAFFQETDIALDRQVTVLIERIVGEYGRLDIAFNNASVEGPYVPLASQPETIVAQLFDFNLNGTWICLKREIQQMIRQNGGSIVNNITNFKTDGTPGCSIYKSTKAAVKTMTQAAAVEYARNNIRINAIAPGILEQATQLAQGNGRSEGKPANIKLVPMGRGGKFEEVADAVIWLCSDRASFITGHVLAVDGGLTAITTS